MSSHRIPGSIVMLKSSLQHTASTLSLCRKLLRTIWAAHRSMLSAQLLPTCLIARSLRPLLNLSLSIHFSGGISLLLR